MAKRKPQTRNAPSGPSLHEYAERASEWILHYKFTVIAAAAVLLGALVLIWVRGHEARASEARAWAEVTRLGAEDLEGLRAGLAELEGTSAYPWAVLEAAVRLYHRGDFQEARSLLEPVAENPEIDPYPRGYCLYLLGCIYLETERPGPARKSLEKALTVNGKSPFLRELVSGQLEALKDWPPGGRSDSGGEAGSAEPTPRTGSTEGGP